MSACGECADCSQCLKCLKLTNCKFMYGCVDCIDCSGLVKAHGQRGVHKEPVNFAICVAADMCWMTPDAQAEQIYEWAMKYTTTRPRWDLPASEPISALGSGRILISAFGTRGDVQPCVGLALELQKAGYTVRMIVNSPHDELCRLFDLDVVGCEGWETPFEVVPAVLASGACQRTFYEGVVSFKPELLLYSKLSCSEAWIMEEHLGIPAVQYSFQETMAEPIVWKNSLVGTRMHFDIGLGKRFLQGWNSETTMDHNGRARPAILAISPTISDAPRRFPPSETAGQHVVGYWTIDAKLQEDLMNKGSKLFGGQYKDELVAFLGKGDAPVYIGWGSMAADPDKAQMAVRSLKDTGKRGIILGGVAGIDTTSLAGAPDFEQLKAYAEANILFLPSAPHEWLLPQCCLAVHHGGSGTLAVALRAGIPNIVTPVAVDQFQWAKIVNEKGLGVGTGELKTLKGEHLTMAIRHCEKPEIVAAAKACGERLCAEDGAGNAAKGIASYVALLRKRGEARSKREDGCIPSSCEVL